LISWLKSLLRKLRPAGAGAADFDPDLGDVFLAELDEVALSVKAACASWRADPGDREALVRMRRGFHTLKGSAPLIGAKALGEFCAQTERVTTRLIEMPSRPSAETLATMEQAVAVLPEFARSMRDTSPPPPLRTLTERLRRISR